MTKKFREIEPSNRLYILNIFQIIDMVLSPLSTLDRDTKELLMVIKRYIEETEKKQPLCLLCDNSSKHPSALIITMPVDRTTEVGVSAVFALCPNCGGRDRTADILKKLDPDGSRISLLHEGPLTKQ